MKRIFLLLIGALLINAYGFKIGNPSIPKHETSNAFFQHDTSRIKLEKFKAFSKKFFQAISSNDTAFIKAHVIFPITNSALTEMDSTLERSKKVINHRYFFKNLRKLFPEDLIKRIDKQGEFTISDPIDGKIYFIITVYDIGDGQLHYNWIFIEKRNIFYFTLFTAEPN